MKTIMVVDDEPNILEKVKTCLETDDFEVITAMNSREALKIIDDDVFQKVQLILIDTPMPGGMKSAFFSVKPNSKRDTSTIENFLQKPFTNEELLGFVKTRI